MTYIYAEDVIILADNFNGIQILVNEMAIVSKHQQQTDCKSSHNNIQCVPKVLAEAL